jgi:peroxin-6
MTLHVPLQLLPRFFNIPLQATLHCHRLVCLSTVILQPIVVEETYGPLEASDLDLKPLMHPSGSTIANGYLNGDNPSRAATIWREGHNITIRDATSQRHQPFRIAMLEPAAQGYISTDTRVIISATPFVFGENDDEDDDHVDGIIDGLSSHGKTHISLADFDPDAFLSSSLDLALRNQSSNGFDTDHDDMAQSISSTSGSVTPRPPGTRMPAPPSPPARLDEIVDGDEEDADGVRLSAVRAMGPTGNDQGQEVCWMSVGSLGRAGVFEGDWVCRLDRRERPPNTIGFAPAGQR